MAPAVRSTLEITSFVPAQTLSGERERWLHDGLIAALPGLRMAELFAQRRDMFRDADLITVATDGPDGPPVAALSSAWAALPSGRRFLHVLTQFVGEDYQQGRAPVFRRSWGDHFAHLCPRVAEFPSLIVLKTYNPIAFCAMQAFVRIGGVTIYPEVRTEVSDADVRELAEQVAQVVSPGLPFDSATGVIRGAGVPRDLYPELPTSTDLAVNARFAATLRPGDRMLAMLSIPGPVQAAAILGAFGITAP